MLSYGPVFHSKPTPTIRPQLRPILTIFGIAAFDLGWVLWWGHRGLIPHHIVGRSHDPYIYLWFLKWWGWAISHHKSLVLTRLASSPVGNNILWDTGVPIFFIPFSLLHWYLHIPIDTVFNVIWIGSWAGTGVVAFWTFYRLTRNLWASALGHLLVLFSAYENSESLAHLDLMWLGFIFLFFMVGIEWMTQRRTTWSFILWGSILGLLQWLCNEELFGMMWVAFILALLVRPSFKRLSVSSGHIRQEDVWPTTAILTSITALLVLPFFWIQIHAAGQPSPNSIRFAGFFSIDIQNLVWRSVSTIWHSAPGAHWFGNPYEDVGFLGVIFFLGWTLYWLLEWSSWSPVERLSAKWITLWWALLTLMALGPFIRWGGHVIMVAPGLIAAFVPVLKDMVLPRFMGIALWPIGLGSTWALARSQKASVVSPAALSIGLLILSLSWLPAPHPALSTHTGERGAIPDVLARIRAPKHPVLLVFPYDNVAHPTNLLWVQARDRFHYRLAEGYLSPNDPLLHKFPRLVAAWDHLDAPGSLAEISARPFPARAWRTSVRRYLSKTQATAVILLRKGRHFRSDDKWWESLLGRPSGTSLRTVYWSHPLKELKRK